MPLPYEDTSGGERAVQDMQKILRGFWRPVADRLSGYTCPCQNNEPEIREDKGDYVWRGVTR